MRVYGADGEGKFIRGRMDLLSPFTRLPLATIANLSLESKANLAGSDTT
jgi:hypothetical protein